MQITWARSASKELQALPKAKQVAVLEAVSSFAVDPFGSHPNAKPLKGSDGAVRLRVGEYRVVLVRGKGFIDVVKVAHRKDVYR
ncbi:MAG: type II toxin-antitoxin system RelE/ParE family toxin [Rhodospirillaceae bacterium]|nr:MAG: type II toxin-antitoxin system RelE/ParE family toxin [Rhodospirillaceae bacterium]